jgi:hypothetical protein
VFFADGSEAELGVEGGDPEDAALRNFGKFRDCHKGGFGKIAELCLHFLQDWYEFLFFSVEGGED